VLLESKEPGWKNVGGSVAVKPLTIKETGAVARRLEGCDRKYSRGEAEYAIRKKFREAESFPEIVVLALILVSMLHLVPTVGAVAVVSNVTQFSVCDVSEFVPDRVLSNNALIGGSVYETCPLNYNPWEVKYAAVRSDLDECIVDRGFLRSSVWRMDKLLATCQLESGEGMMCSNMHNRVRDWNARASCISYLVRVYNLTCLDDSEVVSLYDDRTKMRIALAVLGAERPLFWYEEETYAAFVCAVVLLLVTIVLNLWIRWWRRHRVLNKLRGPQVKFVFDPFLMRAKLQYYEPDLWYTKLVRKEREWDLSESEGFKQYVTKLMSALQKTTIIGQSHVECEAVMPTSTPTGARVKDSVLTLTVNQGDSNDRIIGTAVSVAQGCLITCAHVLDSALSNENPEITVWIYEGEQWYDICKVRPASCIRHDAVDLALIPIPAGVKTVRMGPPRAGMSVIMFDATDKTHKELLEYNPKGMVSPGIINNVSADLVRHSATTLSGDSGNALFHGYAMVALHVGRSGTGTGNEAIAMSDEIRSWILENHDYLKKGPITEALPKEWTELTEANTVFDASEVTMEKVLTGLGLTADHERRERVHAVDEDTVIISMDGFDVLCDTLNPDKVYTSVIYDGGINFDCHYKDIASNADTFVKLGNKIRSGHGAKIVHGKLQEAKVQARRTGRNPERRRLKNKRGQRSQIQSVTGVSSKEALARLGHKESGLIPELLGELKEQAANRIENFPDIPPTEQKHEMKYADVGDEDEEVFDIAVPCLLPGCEIVKSCSARHYVEDQYFERQVEAKDFGLEEDALAEYTRPEISLRHELSSMSKVLGKEQSKIVTDEELEEFLQFCRASFGHKPDQYCGEISLAQAWDDVLRLNGDKVPGVRFQDRLLSPCQSQHVTKQAVYDCPECKSFVEVAVHNMLNSESDYEVYFNTFLKVEITKASKVREGRQRVVQGNDLAFELVQRIIYSKTYEFMERGSIMNPVILGFCIFKGGHKVLSDRFKANQTIQGDITSQDLNMTSEQMRVALAAWHDLTSIPDSFGRKFVEKVLITNKNFRIGNQIIKITDSARPAAGINPSGHFLTTICNSFSTFFCLFRAQKRLLDSSTPMWLSGPLHYQQLIHGDDWVLSIPEVSSELAQRMRMRCPTQVRKAEVYVKCITESFSENGYQLKAVEFKDAHSFTFLGLEWFYDKAVKIRMAFPIRSFLRLKYPLKITKEEDYQSQVRNYSINFCNNPKFMHGLRQLADKEGVKLFDEKFCKWVMDGTEANFAHNSGQSIPFHDRKGKIRFKTSLRRTSGGTRANGESHHDSKAGCGSSSRRDVALIKPDGGSDRKAAQTNRKKRKKGKEKHRARQSQSTKESNPIASAAVPRSSDGEQRPSRPPIRRPQARGKEFFNDAKENSKEEEKQTKVGSSAPQWRSSRR